MTAPSGGGPGEWASGWHADHSSATSADHAASLPRRNNRPTHANIVVTITQEESVRIVNTGLEGRADARAAQIKNAGHVPAMKPLGDDERLCRV
jgi:hypothetical protein